jgi:hypothetical protein
MLTMARLLWPGQLAHVIRHLRQLGGAEPISAEQAVASLTKIARLFASDRVGGARLCTSSSSPGRLFCYSVLVTFPGLPFLAGISGGARGAYMQAVRVIIGVDEMDRIVAARVSVERSVDAPSIGEVVAFGRAHCSGRVVLLGGPSLGFPVSEKQAASHGCGWICEDAGSSIPVPVKAELLQERGWIHDRRGARAGKLVGVRSADGGKAVGYWSAALAAKDALSEVSSIRDLSGLRLYSSSESDLGWEALAHHGQMVRDLQIALTAPPQEPAGPGVVWSPERSRSHCVISLLAWLTARKLSSTIPLGPSAAVEAMREALVTDFGQGVYLVQRTAVWDDIDAALGLAMPRPWATIEQLRLYRRDLGAALAGGTDSNLDVPVSFR